MRSSSSISKKPPAIPWRLKFCHGIAGGFFEIEEEERIPFMLRREDEVEKVKVILRGQNGWGLWPRQSILTEKYEIPRPVAVKVVELTESSMTIQRAAATVFPVGTRVKVWVDNGTRKQICYND